MRALVAAGLISGKGAVWMGDIRYGQLHAVPMDPSANAASRGSKGGA